MNFRILSFQNMLQDIVFQYQYHQVARYIVSFVVSIIMVRSALPQKALGGYELLVFFIVSISGFWANGIKNAFISYYHSLEASEKKRLPFTVFIILSGIAILLGIGLILFPKILSFFHAEILAPYRAIIAIYLLFFATLPMIETIYLLEKKSQKLFHYTHWSQAGILILTIMVALVKPELSAFIGILILWASVRWLYLLVAVLRPFGFDIYQKQIYIFAVFSLPLVLNMVLGSAMEMIDGLFVAHFFDTEFFPVFRYGAREMPLSSLLFGSLSLAMIPMLSKNPSNLTILKAKATKHMHLLAPLSILFMVISPYVYVWFYGAAFQESAYIFNIYLLIMVSRVIMPQTICFAKHQHAIIIWSGIFEIIANIGLSYWWLQYWGVYGLAAGTIMAFLLHKIILLIYNYKVNQIRFSEYIAVKPYFIYTLLLLLTFFITLKGA